MKFGDIMRIINAQSLVLGRLASKVAKSLLNGEEIAIVNAEKVVIVGSKRMIMTEYKRRRRLNHPRKGPRYPRMPDRILKRTVRGMLPYQRPRGREAYKNLKVYIGVPDEYTDKNLETIEAASRIKWSKYVILGDISRELGATF